MQIQKSKYMSMNFLWTRWRYAKLKWWEITNGLQSLFIFVIYFRQVQLKDEKLKVSEEAEELAQEIAEIRHQLTG